MKRFFYLLLFFTCFVSIAQENPIKNPTVEEQFNYIFKVSRSYQYFKVVNKDRLLKLQNNVLDTLTTQKNELNTLRNKLNSLEKDVRNLKNSNQSLTTQLNTIDKQNNSINFLGMAVSTTIYNVIVWGLILILLAGMGYFIYKFLNNTASTKEAIANLEIVEKEFEMHRKKSLEREQKLRRKVHDLENNGKD